MNAAVDFYFDFSSPYGYFAAERIDALAAKYDRKVNWQPVLLGAIFKTTGGLPLPMIPLKGEYAMRDIHRCARFHGIPYRHPEKFPVATQTAGRAMVWLKQEKGDAVAADFARAVYRAYFAEGEDITDAQTIARIATRLDLDGNTLLEAANSAPAKERLKADTEAALARGVFGSPFVIADGEPFWGFDRFDQLEAFLKNGSI